MACIHVLGSIVLGIMILSMMTPSQAVPLTGLTKQDEKRSIETIYSEVEYLKPVADGIEVMLRVALKTLCATSIHDCLNLQVCKINGLVCMSNKVTTKKTVCFA